MEEKDSWGLREHEQFERRVIEENDRQNHRIADLEKALEQNNKLLVSVEKLAINMESMQQELNEQGKRLEELENAPLKEWQTAKKTLITAILSAVGGAFAAGLIGIVANYI